MADPPTDIAALARDLSRQLIDVGAACQKAQSFAVCTDTTPLRSVYDVYAEKIEQLLRGLIEFQEKRPTLAHIYPVTALHLLEGRYGRSPRTVAWYSRLDTAQQSVVENWGDIWETTYQYVVIEELEQGLYPQVTAEYWYEWQSGEVGGRYEPCSKPVAFERTISFAIG